MADKRDDSRATNNLKDVASLLEKIVNDIEKGDEATIKLVSSIGKVALAFKQSYNAAIKANENNEKVSSGFSKRFIQGAELLQKHVPMVSIAIPYLTRFAASLGSITAMLAPFAIALGAVATLAGTLYGGFKLLSSISAPIYSSMRTVESQLIRLKSAFQDGKKAAAEFSKGLLFAGKTPFAVTDVTEAIAGLRTFKFEPFKTVDLKTGRDLMTVLGDMAGAMGTDLATASWALQRAMVGEWEIMQNNFQISARMIPELKNLKSGTEEYGAAIVKHLASVNRFRGGMEETAKSIRGLISNISDMPKNFLIGIGSVNLNRGNLAGATLYSDVTESLKKLYDSVSQGNALERFSSSVGKMIDMGPGYENILNRMANGTLKFKDILDMKKTEGGFTDKAIEGFRQMEELSSKTGISIARLQGIMAMKKGGASAAAIESELVKAGGIDAAYSRIERILHYGQLVGQMLRAVFASVVAPAIEMLAGIFDSALDKMESFFSFLPSLESLTTGSTTSMKNAVENAAKAIGLTSKQIASGLENLSEGLNRSINEEAIKAMGPLERRLMIFAMLMELLKNVIKIKVKELQQIFQPTIDSIAQFVQVIWSATKAVWDIALGFFASIAEGFLKAFDSGGKGAERFNAILSIAIKFTSMLISVFTFLAKPLGFILKVIGFFTGAFIGGAVAMVGDFAIALNNLGTLDFLDGVINSFQQFINLIDIAYDKLRNSAFIKTAIKGIVDSVNNFFAPFYKLIDIIVKFIGAIPEKGFIGSLSSLKKGALDAYSFMMSDKAPGRFYGDMNTKEGLHYLHNNEMIVPAKYADAIRKNVMGIGSQPQGTSSFDSGLRRVASRTDIDVRPVSRPTSDSGKKIINVSATNNFYVEGDVDREAVEYTLPMQITALNKALAVI